MRNRFSPVMGSAICGLLVAAASGAPAFAQAAGTPAGTPADTQADTANDRSDIVVTAQRREEKARDVPISLTAITADVLGQGDVQELSDIQKLTPGLRFDNFGGFAQPTIRGVGTAVSASGAGSNVGIYVDGFYAPNPLSNDFQLLNVSGITVLKGPQGTLFGRNTTGGAIQVTTNEPTNETHGIAEVSYGRFDAQKYQGYVTTGLTDTLSVALGGLYRTGDGFLKNIATGGKKDGAYDAWALRGEIKFKPSSDFSMLFRYIHADTKDPTSVAFTSYSENGVPFSAGAIYGGIAATRRGEVSNTSRTFFDSLVNAYQFKVEGDLGFATVRSYTQYRREKSRSFLDLDASSLALFDVDFRITDEIFTQEVIVTSEGSGPFQWTVGGFAFVDNNRFTRLNGYVAGGPPTLISRSQTDTKSFAGYADGTYNINDRFFITAGVRYSHDEVNKGGFFLGPLAGGGGFVPIPSISDDRLTPRAVLRYKPSNASSIYASYSGGHKAAILNPNGFTTDPVDAERIKAFEAGYKYAAGGLSFDFAGFYYKYTDLQVASYLRGAAVIRNAADSRVYGAEGQITYDVTRQFQFNVAAGYTNGKYDRFDGAPAYFQCLDAAACGAGFGLFVVTPIDASDLRMARTPRFTGNVGARYETPLGGGMFALSGNLAYTSRVYFDSVQQFSTAAYELLSLRAQWTDPSERFTFAVYGDNLTDSKYYSQVLQGEFGINATYGTPATWGVSVRAKF